MYDVARLKRGARAAYNLAPQPATFLTLVSAAHDTLAQLRQEFASLPPPAQQKHEAWAKDASAYDSRLTAEHFQAQKLIGMIQEGTLDWQAALKAGSDYAQALNRFFQGGDSAYWADLANRLAVIRAESVPGAATFQRPWLLELWMPWTAAQNLVVEELAESAQSAGMADETKSALAKHFDTAEKYVREAAVTAGLGILALGGLAAAVWLLVKD